MVSFHAHPDDEVLFTGGTLARVAAEGHRVILAVATAGGAGQASERYDRQTLAAQRMRELEESATVLGCADLVTFDFPDSGWRVTPPPGSFSQLPVAEAAAPLADLLRRERADALTVYDQAGGYGHPDHRQVHDVGTYAAGLAGTRLVLEATMDRRSMQTVARLVQAVPRVLPEIKAEDFADAYTDRADLTHRVDVRAYLDHKRRALLAHLSQASASRGTRTLALLLRLPPFLFSRALGYERFVEQGRNPDRRHQLDDVFATLR